MLLPTTNPNFKTFRHNEDGVITVYGFLLIMAFIMVGGLGLDYASGVRVKTQLQVAADSAAHAAIVARSRINSNTGVNYTEDEARAIGVAVAQRLLPQDKYGDAILPADIKFGTWDEVNRAFTPVAGSRTAVMVDAQQLQSRGNGASAYFWKLYDVLPQMDVLSQSVYETYYPTCYREGFVATQRIDVQSNNTYRAGFCIHSNSHIEMNSGNTFEDGVIVSMPDQADLTIPSSGMTSNSGLAAALRSGGYHIKVLQRIDDIIAGYDDSTSDYYRPDYLFDPNHPDFPNVPIQRKTISSGNNNKLEVAASDGAAGWEEWHIHTATCNGNKKLVLGNNVTLSNGVIHTNCEVNLGSATLENVLLISTNTALTAVQTTSGLVLGRDDNCSEGGGVQIVTLGGFRATSSIEMYGAQILAMKTIDFEANGNGVEGVSLVTAGEIDSTSNMDMGFCNGAGMENNFDALYFRMAG